MSFQKLDPDFKHEKHINYHPGNLDMETMDFFCGKTCIIYFIFL